MAVAGGEAPKKLLTLDENLVGRTSSLARLKPPQPVPRITTRGLAGLEDMALVNCEEQDRGMRGASFGARRDDIWQKALMEVSDGGRKCAFERCGKQICHHALAIICHICRNF